MVNVVTQTYEMSSYLKIHSRENSNKFKHFGYAAEIVASDEKLLCAFFRICWVLKMHLILPFNLERSSKL